MPFCQAGLAAWQRVDGRGGGHSALALRSVRSMAAEMVTVILARSVARRWCETEVAGPAAVGAFAEVFPSAVFVCFHRGFAGVAGAALEAYRWGLADSPFWGQAVAYPGDSLTAVAAYWAGAAGSLVEFEATHRDSCLRVRYEDLATNPAAGGRVFSWLGLDGPDHLPALPRNAASPSSPAAAAVGTGAGG